jgi:hypothetical protein
MISRWLAGTVKPAAFDRAANPSLQQEQQAQAGEAKDAPGSAHVHILGRAGELAKRVIRSMTPPQGIPAGNALFPKPGEKSSEPSESKAKAASASNPQ